jgi:membrane protease YdiL (CAAX protease family)
VGIGVVAYALLPALLEEYIFRGIVLKKLWFSEKGGPLLYPPLLFMIVHASPFQIVGLSRRG